VAEGHVPLFATEPPAAAGGELDRRIVSILFADVVGFTPLSERLDSEDVATIQDAYFAATRETIERYGGVVRAGLALRAATDSATQLMRASSALIDSWLSGSAESALRAADLAAAIPAPFWELRARSATPGS